MKAISFALLAVPFIFAVDAYAAPISNTTGTLVGTGVNGAGNTTRIQLDNTGDGESDITVVITAPNAGLSDRIQDAIDNEHLDVTFIDVDGDGKFDPEDEFIFEA